MWATFKRKFIGDRNFYRKVIQLRKELSCVRHDVYKEYGKHSSTLYMYSMEDKYQKILVVCSFSEYAQKWKAPADFDINQATLIVNNVEKFETNVLRPYEARVYLKKK